MMHDLSHLPQLDRCALSVFGHGSPFDFVRMKYDAKLMMLSKKLSCAMAGRVHDAWHGMQA
jgi:hypothetical protein